MGFRSFFSSLMFIFSLVLLAPFAHADTPPPGNTPPAQTDAEKLAAYIKENEELKKQNEELKKKTPPGTPPPDDDLRAKAEKERIENERKGKDTKTIEAALTFNLGVDTFVKNNADLLPTEIAEIVRLGHKENYDNAAAKANAMKAAIVQSYFAIQENVDSLTQSQKDQLADYLKLTKTSRESDKAAMVYENLFEPALETVRRVKKALEVGRSRSGLAGDNKGDKAYAEKLAKVSRQHYLREKKEA